MNATDLRLGNYVLGGYKSVILQVNDIVLISQDGFPRINGWREEDVLPIRITPEILENIGKKCGNVENWQYQISVGALKWYFRWNTEWYSEIGGIYIDSRVQYVHQLQNLYYALSGSELNLSL